MNKCACDCPGCLNFHRGDAPGTKRQAHLMRLKLALDICFSMEARERGIRACDGQDEDSIDEITACRINDVHFKGSQLAIALADAISTPGPSDVEEMSRRCADLVSAMALAFASKPTSS